MATKVLTYMATLSITVLKGGNDASIKEKVTYMKSPSDNKLKHSDFHIAVTNSNSVGCTRYVAEVFDNSDTTERVIASSSGHDSRGEALKAGRKKRREIVAMLNGCTAT